MEPLERDPRCDADSLFDAIYLPFVESLQDLDTVQYSLRGVFEHDVFWSLQTERGGEWKEIVLEHSLRVFSELDESVVRTRLRHSLVFLQSGMNPMFKNQAIVDALDDGEIEALLQSAYWIYNGRAAERPLLRPVDSLLSD